MNVDRSPELTLLLMACTVHMSTERRSQLIHFLNQHQLDWERLYTLANRHRLIPFLYRTLRDIPAVPESFLSTLRQECQAIATDTLLKLHEYKRVTALLTDHGIEHIAYKGVHLAENGYPDPGLRICGDIDILVEPKAAPGAIRLLQAQQYHLNKKHTLYWEHSNRSLLNDLCEVSLFKPFFANYFDIDLHWAVVCFNKHYKLFRLGDFLSQPTFSTELQVVLLVTHHGVTNIWQHIYYVNDLYFLLKDKEIDWTWLRKELNRYGLETVFLVGLHWCQQVWNLPLPLSIQALIETNSIHALAGAYEKNWEANQSLESSSLVLKQLTFFAKAQTQFGKLIKIYFTFFTSRVFRASTFKIGGRMLYIPKELGFITIFIRATRSFHRFLPTRQ